ncbi:MAG: universal stress protein [Nitrosopumilus sp.]|nr:universal stress protein [Nitrosopumilus sp.]
MIHQIDLIVMGSHGRSGFKKLVLESVVSGVAIKASIPVLTKIFKIKLID